MEVHENKQQEAVTKVPLKLGTQPTVYIFLWKSQSEKNT